MAQDYSDVLAILQQDLIDRSNDARAAMDTVNQVKGLIAQIQALNPQIPLSPPADSPPPTSV